MAKFFFALLAIIIIIILHFGFLPAVFANYSQFFNLPLFFISLLAFFAPIELAIFSALILGLLLDIYAPFFFGFHTLTLLVAVLLIKFFVANFFQHQHLVSLLLTNVLTIVVYFSFYLVYYFLAHRVLSPLVPYLLSFFVHIAFHSFLVLLVITLPNPLDQKIKSQKVF